MATSNSLGANIGYLLITLILFAIALFFFAWIVQITWNGSVVHMARGASTLTYWQAMAFLVLVTVVGSFFLGARGYINISRVMS